MEIIPKLKSNHFRLVQDSELPAILDYLEKFLPESLKFHQTIRTYLNDKIWQFYFYVSKNWPEEPVCLHFPGCTLTPNNNVYESIGIFCPSSNIECLDILETENELINWKKPLYLNYTHKAIIDRVERFYCNIGTLDKMEGDIYVYKKPFNELDLEELSPNEVEMRPLSVQNMKAIHDLYPASEIESIELFEKLVDILPGVGIFCSKSDELAAWMVHSYYGAMFSMQTRPEFRRKGYGIHLAKTLTNVVIERGYLPFVVIRPENDASRNLYMKLGFEKAYETVRVKLRPHFKQNNGYSNNQNDNHKIENIFNKKCSITNNNENADKNGKTAHDDNDESINKEED